MASIELNPKIRDYVNIVYPILDSRKEETLIKDCPICTCGTVKDPAICINPESTRIKRMDNKMKAFVVAHEQAHLKYRECVADEACAAIKSKNFLRVPEKEFEGLLVKWFVEYRPDAIQMSSNKRTLRRFLEILRKHTNNLPRYLAKEVESAYNSLK